ncbi:hypothetical protein PV10_03112 [Exophiala mesophila]|uniref:HPP transmembrane region domain-containing protein n=1 Tax=Exophiala mesophila TaxID=212818 RepID=A0A0D2A909_EXOME|nr:uncharacterized protein PV10_03112 [Exophiala mesophila]KIV95458.1 hypothetical protein PV10_03112 [Exophiala mesophila]
MTQTATSTPQPKRKASAPPHRTSRSYSTPFDIDVYLNPYIPRSPLHLLPRHISYFLGYRAPRKDHPSPPPPQRFHDTILYTSIFIGTFCGLAIIEHVFLALPPLSGHTAPIIIASFGAAAILEYNTIESPLAQPRNLFVGHFLSALVAVCVAKLFGHLPQDRYEDLRWLAGAISVGLASMLMSATKSVHPPAGATALMASTTVEIQVLGWWLIPLVLLASVLMLSSALLLNNLAGRRYPIYWWTPVDLKALREERRRARAEPHQVDLEKDDWDGSSPTAATTTTNAATPSAAPPTTVPDSKVDNSSDEDTTEAGSDTGDLAKLSTQETRVTRTISYSSASRVPHLHLNPSGSSAGHRPSSSQRSKAHRGSAIDPDINEDSIIISRERIVIPDWLELNNWEDEILRILMERLRDS